jgi:hypothetical protein
MRVHSAPGEASSPTENSSNRKFITLGQFWPLTHLNPDPIQIPNTAANSANMRIIFTAHLWTWGDGGFIL